MSFRPLVCSLLALVSAPLGAQSWSWQIPARGAAEYERTVDTFVLREAVPAGARRVVRTGAEGGREWRHWQFESAAPPAGWERPGFDDSRWPAGRGGFASDVRDPRFATRWDKPQICLRTSFELPKKVPKAAMLTVSHDDGVVVCINGIEVFRDDGHAGDYRNRVIGGEGLAAMVAGANVLSVQCRNVNGPGHVDVGLTTYERPFGSEDEVLAQTSFDPRRPRGVRDNLFPLLRSPALVLHGELDAKQQAVRNAPHDLRDLGWLAAADLRKSGSAHSRKYDIPRVYDFGDVLVKGRAAKAGRDGRQSLALTVRTSTPARRGDSKRFLERNVLNEVRWSFEGDLAVERVVDMDAGVVREFDVRLTGELRELAKPRDPGYTLELVERWRLAAVRENRDAKFRTAVADAIRKGAEWLKKNLANPAANPIRPDAKDATRSYNSGRLALGLLALIHGGGTQSDPVVHKALDELRRRNIFDTYSLANAIMALEALHAPSGERDDLLEGRIVEPRRRVLPDRDMALVEEWSRKLLANVDTRVDREYVVRFSYVREARFDNSVNQYGLLGLYSAHLCGVEIPANLWQAATNHLLLTQEKSKDKLRLQLCDHRTWHEMQNGDRKTAAAATMTPAAGWAYTVPTAGGVRWQTYGSMTAAGVTGLAICQAGMRAVGQGRTPIVGKSAAAMRAGFAWLARHFTVRFHPGRTHYERRFLYYYLYSVERACELSGVALFNGRDWYYDGAMALITTQQADGAWPPDMRREQPIERTAMAVLFLKKSALPVYTVR